MTLRRASASHPRRRQRGVGTLVVVLVLFFVISLVAAYSSRNMIFEQKTSANQYRSTQAFETADAGAEWALAMVNAGRIDSLCAPTPNAAATSFRDRYLAIDPATGAVTAKTSPGGGTLTPECVRTAAGWSCSCPDNGLPVLVAPVGSAPAPAFRLTVNPSGTGGRPGVFYLRSQACTRLSDNCLGTLGVGAQGDAVARVTVQVALKGAIATPPSAALTAGGAIDLGGAAARVTNTEPLVNGTTIDARGAVAPAGLTLVSTPGTPGGSSVVDIDTGLPAAPDLMFASVFGMNRDTYKQQPATIVLSCPAQCGAAALSAMAAKNPGRILWLEGDASLDAAVDIGSASSPVVLVSHGNLVATAPARIFGLVYAYNDAGPWVTGGSPTVQGAVVAEGDVGGNGAPIIVYDLGILNTLRLASGSFVRVPGGWKDF